VSRISIGRPLKRGWMPVVGCGCGGGRGRGVVRVSAAWDLRLAQHDVDCWWVSDETAPLNPKRVVLEVFGPPGAVASINYLDVNAAPQRVDDTVLPWSYDVTTTDPAVFVNIVARGDSDSIGCRIIIDGVVKDERSVKTVNAYTFCLDKSG